MKASKMELNDIHMLRSNSPNVKKSAFKILNREVQSVRKLNLISAGTCNLHIVIMHLAKLSHLNLSQISHI